ncbi:nudix hydrolase domain protein [Faustovirus]|nr:hypothetical protein F-LCD7_0344 [Faustovirus]QJX72606.1 nudix hydrolase domain protein [Faustovirus]QJX73103.1 hypothetical protein F-VV57_0342 [Faustovirus]QJX73610.1 hypothetical protein F-VV63_0344 [Faustovirus]QJX74117.1 hypothetical protein F-E9_363 [Faustovirus]
MPQSKRKTKSSKHRKAAKSRRRTKSKVRLPKPTKGSLGDYTTKSPAPKRRASLQRQIREKDYATVIRELNIRATLSKHNAPKASQKMKADMQFLKNKN